MIYNDLSQRIFLVDQDNFIYQAEMFGHADKDFGANNDVLNPTKSVQADVTFEAPADAKVKAVRFADHIITFE